MFGSIPLSGQLPVAFRINLAVSVVAVILLHDRIRHTRTLCFGLGASSSAVLVTARQVAKQAGAMGALNGSLCALIGLTVLPNFFAALLFTRCAESFMNRMKSTVHPPWHRLALRIGLTLTFVTIVDKVQPVLTAWLGSLSPTNGITKTIALLSVVLLVLGNVDYRGQGHADKVMNFWFVVHATLLALALQSVFRNAKYPIVSLKGGVRILNSTQSVTGTVVVGENLVEGYRFLRCDHSLLGGRWIKENERGATLYGDSIFSAFVLQEAGRLAWRNEDVDDDVPLVEIIMKPDGILVVVSALQGASRHEPAFIFIGRCPLQNFAGILQSQASQAVFKTLWFSFPQCRAFQDKYGHKDEETRDQLANMVIICSRALSPLLAFRPSGPPDYLKSPLRLRVLGSFLQHEMLPDRFIRGFELDQDVAADYVEEKLDPLVLRQGLGMDSLDEWQIGSAIATWNAMRQIMTVEAWMAY
ncbi:hypothetical protein QFC22_001495 [Naganishia vaughanmartiniae]|uniref:Uncharacterized protein n=1 Tax=Naganishia vaughanmartiniae TaxID=1424756 RepID=A0ACC2XJ34_9TREE|nr:hypothetical protein QFC22_001495 [Naganishia vaughanmartiniae]